MHIWDDAPASDEPRAPMLPGFEAARRLPRSDVAVPAEARGRIGAQSAALGLGTKADGEVPPDAVSVEAGPVDLKLPKTLGAGWTSAVAGDVLDLAGRVLAIGETAAARRWNALLDRPRSVLFDVEAIRRMVVVMERQAAARAGTLPPVPPAIQYRTLCDIRALSDGSATDFDRVMPETVTHAVLDAVNARLRGLAAAGFASPHDRGIHLATADIRSLRVEISHITGATSRALNQIGLLRAVSRRGQTAHRGMSLDRRLRLVEDALAQLAGHLGRDSWDVGELGLVPSGLREAWERREITTLLPSPHARTLFEWAAPATARHPVALSEHDLLFEIQRNPDLDYVYRLRAERTRRAGEEASAGRYDPTEIRRYQER